MNEIAMHTDFMVPNQFNKNELLRIPTNFCLFHSTFFSVKKYQYTCTCSYIRFAQNVAGESKHIKTLILCRADETDTRKAAFIEF